MGRHLQRRVILVVALVGVAHPTLAQDKPAPIVEAIAGRSGFIDEAWDYFTTVGGGARIFVTPRLAIGPEIAYLRGDADV